MATVRLIVVLLLAGTVVLLGVQNLSPALPLVFFGGSTLVLPLGVWLVSAIALGAITTLGLTALVGSVGGARQRAASYKYRPQSFYEPAAPSAASPPGSRGDDPAADDPSWRAWTNLRSPGQWSDWESLSQAPKPETAPGSSATAAASGIIDGVTTWFSSSKQRAKQQQKVDESLRELDTDWDDIENRPYTAPGGSPVQDSLDDINQGWDAGDRDRPSTRSVEASQTPRRVYRDGSIYSYSYREENDPAPSGGQVDNIYAPPDDAIYDDDYPGPHYSTDDYYAEPGYASEEADYEASDDDTPLGEPEIAEDGVVDADYRVIVPPYSAAAEAAATAETWIDGSTDDADDDWDETDDALTP